MFIQLIYMHGIVSDGLQGQAFLGYSRKINPYWVHGLGNGGSPHHEMAVNSLKQHFFKERITRLYFLSYRFKKNVLKTNKHRAKTVTVAQ